MILGWPYAVVAASEPRRTSWTAPLDAVRLGPDDDETGVTAAQVRDVVTRLTGPGLIIACHTQLRLARPLANHLRLPWERLGPPGRLTPRPGAGADSGPSASSLARQPARRNPASPAPDGRRCQGTAAPTQRHDVGKHSKTKPTQKLKGTPSSDWICPGEITGNWA